MFTIGFFSNTGIDLQYRTEGRGFNQQGIGIKQASS